MSLKIFIPILTRNISPFLTRNYSSTLNRRTLYTQIHQTIFPLVVNSQFVTHKHTRNIFGIKKDSTDKPKSEEIEKKENSELPEEEPQTEEEILKIQELQDSLEKSKNELKEVNKKYLYSLAEIENTRKSSEQKLQDSRLFAIRNFSRDLLSIADTLESAVNTVKPTDMKDASKTFTDLFEGVKMTELNLQRVFTRHGLERISPLGEKFNPDYHESAFLMPGEYPGTVGEVRTIGYLLNGRLLRPSLVGVVMEKS